MRVFVPLAIVTAAALAVYMAVPDAPEQQETFGQYARRHCSVEATEPRRQDCYDRMLLKRAFDNSNVQFEQKRREILR